MYELPARRCRLAGGGFEPQTLDIFGFPTSGAEYEYGGRGLPDWIRILFHIHARAPIFPLCAARLVSPSIMQDKGGVDNPSCLVNKPAVIHGDSSTGEVCHQHLFSAQMGVLEE